MLSDNPYPIDLAEVADALAGRLGDLAANLNRIDSTLADAINEHLDAIGLDDNQNETHEHRRS